MSVSISGSTGLSVTGAQFLVGQVIFTAGSTNPVGFLKCDGSAISRTAYASLFAVCGETYGAGNGSTTFNLPDLRGEFIRGLDDGRGIDTGRVVGTAQADALKSHSHAFNSSTTTSGSAAAAVRASTLGDLAVSTGLSGSTETRPRNVALLACIFTGI